MYHIGSCRLCLGDRGAGTEARKTIQAAKNHIFIGRPGDRLETDTVAPRQASTRRRQTMTPDHKRLLAALLVRLSRSAKRWLDDHSWRPVADLARRIEAVDFDRRVDYEPKPHDAKPLTGRPKAAAGRVLLMPELIEVLTKDGACEVRDGAAGQEIRLVGAATADVAAPQCCNGTVETAVQRRRRVDAAAKVLKEGCPDLVAAVEQDRVSVSAAADLAELP